MVQPKGLNAMKVLVTGATGFVGNALIRRLVEEGFEVNALVRSMDQIPHMESIGANLHMANIGDPNAIAEAAKGCEVVYHCAGENSYRTPAKVLQWINIAGTENVILAARHVGCRRFIHLSCADVTLTNQDRLNWNENRSVLGHPLNPCAYSKLLAEEVALTQSSSKMEITAVRAAWIWGPGDRTTLPGLCQEAEKGGVRMFGKGDSLIATLYIDNLVEALISATNAPDVSCKCYYVTDGEFLTTREFLTMICRSAGLPPPRAGVFPFAFAAAWIREFLNLQGSWTTDVVRRGRATLFDTQSAVVELNYKPSVSVSDGMQKLAEWVKQVGGPKVVAQMNRHPATEKSIEEQVRLAAAARK